MRRARAVVLGALAFLMLVSALSQAPAAVSATQQVVGTKVTVPGGSYRALTPRELKLLLAHKSFLLVNVHYPYAGELPNTDRFIHYDTIGQHLSALPANKHAMIVLYCRSGRMSDIAARTLVRLGFTNVYHLAGGMIGWQKQGYTLLFRQH